jgi:signal peptidase I
VARATKPTVWREYLEALLVAGLFLGFTNTFVLKTFYIPSGSMEDTLLVGDHLIVNRFIYGPEPAALRAVLPSRSLSRGDIVVFRSPEDPQIDLVKRCVGLSGDTVQMVHKRLLVNGRQVADEEYALHRDPQTGVERNVFEVQRYQRDNFAPFTVPPGHYFFLGDNRDFSYDSRYWGPVPAHFIKGRAFVIYWSYGGETPDGRPVSLAKRLGQLLRTTLGFFSRTRWERTFQIIR